MRTGILLTALASLISACVPADEADEGGSAPIVLDGAVLINGHGSPPLEDAVVVVDGETISCAGRRAECDIPVDATIVDVSGRWVMPGIIDAHVHFSQTGWVDGRPDAVDLRDLHPYEKVQARLRTNPERYFRAYLCSGVTGVFDVGGYPWTWSLPGRGESDLLAPRIGAAGPLLSTVDHWLNLPGELQLIHMADEESVRATVRYHATRGTEAIKVWYVMPPQPPDTARMAALVRAAAEETREAGLRLIVHATGLWEAKDAVRAGADLLVHSVFEEPVDDEFLALARESGVIYTPTITVIEGYGDVYLRSLDDSRYPLDCVDPLTRSFATPNAIASDRLPPFASDAAVAERQQRRLDFAMSNAKAVFDAGISVAMGTDAGNPGTFHGPSVYREMELFQQAGFSPMDVLVASTLVSARALDREADLGTLEAGKKADLIVLFEDPTADVRNVTALEWVMKDGVLHERAELLPLETAAGQSGGLP
jgi:imidazolonepropionase-like amidohydrolase